MNIAVLSYLMMSCVLLIPANAPQSNSKNYHALCRRSKLKPFGIWAFQTTLIPNTVFLFCLVLLIWVISGGTSIFCHFFFDFSCIFCLFLVFEHISTFRASSRFFFQAYSCNGTIVTVSVQSNGHSKIWRRPYSDRLRLLRPPSPLISINY